MYDKCSREVSGFFVRSIGTGIEAMGFAGWDDSKGGKMDGGAEVS